MLRHVVMFRWVEGASADQIRQVADSLDGLPRAIPQIADYRHGPDAGINTGNADYVVIGDFATEDDYRIYRDHPVHQRVIADVLAPLIESRVAVQIRLD